MTTTPQETTPPIWGWVCILLGLYPWLAASGIIGSHDPARDTPEGVLILCGFVFIMAGAMILIGQQSRYNSLCAAGICIAFALIGTWISLYGSSDNFSGGLPFLPDATNLMLARILFGTGALLCLSLTFYALKQFFRPAA